jgi:hypothetical protein
MEIKGLSRDSVPRIFFACAVICTAAAAIIFIPMYWSPPIGVYIAALGALAAYMTLRPSQGPVEKAVWVVGIFVLAALEVGNLYHDRDQHEAQEAAARQEQTHEFKVIADGIETSNKNSQQQFDATMKQMGVTLKAAQDTLENTRPKADVQIVGANVLDSQSDIRAKTPVYWNLDYQDFGETPGDHFIATARFFVGRQDNVDDQKRMLKEFNYYWMHSRRQERPSIFPGPPHFATFDGVFTQEEVSQLIAHTATIYFVIRFVWTDPTGRWASDYCHSFQDPGDRGPRPVMHDCQVGIRTRYPFTGH